MQYFNSHFYSMFYSLATMIYSINFEEIGIPIFEHFSKLFFACFLMSGANKTHTIISQSSNLLLDIYIYSATNKNLYDFYKVLLFVEQVSEFECNRIRSPKFGNCSEKIYKRP